MENRIVFNNLKIKTMTKQDLISKTKQECLNLIRCVLKIQIKESDHFRHINPNFINEHYRFDFSGYDYKLTGSCVLRNQEILNKFAYLGIYDTTYFLYLDFYKGSPTLYLKYFDDGKYEEHDFTGYSTSEIIYEVLKLTLDTNHKERRRV